MSHRLIHVPFFFKFTVKPTSISINDYSNKSKVEVRQGEKLQLECKVRGGKPAPRIRWYRKSASSSRIGMFNIT